MSALDRKLIRNIFEMKGQVTAICLVIACGIATYVMSLSTMFSLEDTMNRYYQEYRFAHVFASMKRAPLSLAERIAEIPGVAKVAPRVVQDVTLDIEGFDDPAIGRLISIPDYGEPILNAIHLRQGRMIDPGHTGEVLINEKLGEEHGLQPGDTVKAILNGSKKELTVVGTAITPEYIYQLREGEVLPDDKRFGLFWMNETELAAAFDMEGAFNNITLTVTRSASVPDILRRIDDLIEPYGGLMAYDRSDQTSHQYLSNELTQLRSMGTIGPTIFLSVAAFLLNVVMTRLISTQREEIAALKALGYTGFEIGAHYIKLVVLIVAVGSLLGTVIGARMGQGLTNMYLEFYRFPVLDFHHDPRVVVSALGISLLAGVVGTFAAVWQAVNLPPAEAMRPQPPADFKPTIVERVGLHWVFSLPVRIILRNLERKPFKAAMAVLGIALGVSVLVVGQYGKDSIDYALEQQFSVAQRQDMTVAFVEPLTSRAIHEVEHLPGVRVCEPFRTVPVRMRSEHHSRRVAIMGLPPDGRLFQPLDMDGDVTGLPADGLLVSRVLADVLDVRPGDEIAVEVLEGKRPHHRVRIEGVLDDFAGLSAYMPIDAVHQLMQEGNNLSGAYLQVDPEHVSALYQELKNTPLVASVTIKEAAIESFEETIAENLLRMQFYNVMFAMVIALGVVYNSARVSLSERSRELATLRVMGFTRGEISMILLGELAVLVLAAIPIGLGLGYLFAWYSSTTMVETEMFRIPLVIEPRTYGFSVLVILVSAVLSGLAVRRRLDHLDLIGVLKTRD
ncbi:MAG: ABC transporter permease [Planctomycetota bacterium]|nr:MAG: ABC transporter permease [Planctomycetota bacterium]REJ95061.1 MAG: ABC transporter permease [Planctomycetota bacterium]REK23259.1 MAG: ABC transporter permease [Planctomycetota bacterium]REK30820.1 MAG: ABC transporter permease [Planctomycetota bacterium]